MEYSEHHPLFFTATILEWKPLLKQEKYKEIITNSLSFLVNEKRVEVYGFVIMSNHIHLIWRIMNGHQLAEVQQSFMKFTAQKIIKDLKSNHPQVLAHFYVGASDRKCQIWERNSLSIELHSNAVLLQKLYYIHNNPVKAGLCLQPEAYHYSSASLYLNQINVWNFLTHWEG